MPHPPNPDTLQRYDGFTLHGGAYHSDDVRRILADAHAHYEAQVRPLAGLARPDAGTVPQVLSDARIDAMASAGKVALLTDALRQVGMRNFALILLLKEARKIIRASSSRNLVKDWDQRVTATITNDARRAAE